MPRPKSQIASRDATYVYTPTYPKEYETIIPIDASKIKVYSNNSIDGRPAVEEAANFLNYWYTDPNTINLMKKNMRDFGVTYNKYDRANSKFGYDPYAYISDGLKVFLNTPIYIAVDMPSSRYYLQSKYGQLMLEKPDSLWRYSQVFDKNHKKTTKTTFNMNNNSLLKLYMETFGTLNGLYERHKRYGKFLGKGETNLHLEKKKGYNDLWTIGSPSQISLFGINPLSKWANVNANGKAGLIIHEATHGMDLGALGMQCWKLAQKYKLHGDNYYDGAQEIRSRLMEFRKAAGLKPDANSRNMTLNLMRLAIKRARKNNSGVVNASFDIWAKEIGEVQALKFLIELNKTVADTNSYIDLNSGLLDLQEYTNPDLLDQGIDIGRNGLKLLPKYNH